MNRLVQARIHELSPLSRPGHSCSVKYCDPQNEQTLIRRGLLAGPCVLPEHMYVCIYGDIHVCNENICMVEGPCLVSGMTMGIVHEYSSYNSKDARTWEKKDEKPKSIVPAVQKQYDQVEYLIDTLFYSPKRKDIVSTWTKQRNKLTKKYKDTYIKACEKKRVPVNLIHLAMLEAQYNVPCPIKAKPERDMDRLYQYTKLVMQMIQFMGDEANNCLDIVALGMLYKMQQGIRINNVTLLPKDSYLVGILPPMNDLTKLGIDKKKINRGEQMIMGLYESIERQGKNLIDFALG